MMPELLSKLIKQDTKLNSFTDDKEIIQQGLAPLLVLSKQSTTLQKADLLEKLKLQNWQQNAKFLFKELTKQQIKFLVFKGFAFTHLLYDHSHLRPYSDIDLIIKQTDYVGVTDILKQLGYQQYPSRQGQFVSFQNSFFNKDSPKTVIDVHWQINNRTEFHKHFEFDDLYASAIELNTKHFVFKSLNLIDAFILGCFHYQAHRPNDRKHIWLYDLALIWQKTNSKLQESCLKKAEETNQSSIVLSTLFLLQTTFIDCLDFDFDFDFDFDISHLREEATEYYLQERKKRISDIKTRLRNIDGLKNKIRFINEYVFQSHDYVKHRFGLKSKLWVFLYYPRMWIEDFFKLFK